MSKHSTHRDTQALFRIGDVSRRIGVSPAVLRTWETRYQVLKPARSAAGYRLYTDEDVSVLASMRTHVARGLAPSEAASVARADAAAVPGVQLQNSLGLLREALDAWEGERAGRLVDRTLVTFGLANALRLVALPYLRELGDRWASGEVTVAHEHFASTVVRDGLVRASAGWHEARGPTAVLACAVGEQHDIGLVALGLALHGFHDWRIAYLGADMPVEEVERAAVATGAAVAVVSAADRARFVDNAEAYAAIARRVPLAIGGAGATAAVARLVRGQLLGGDPISAADALAAGFPAAM